MAAGFLVSNTPMTPRAAVPAVHLAPITPGLRGETQYPDLLKHTPATETGKQQIRDKKEAWKQVCADFDAWKAAARRDEIKWTGGTRPLLGELKKEAVKPVMPALSLDDEGDNEDDWEDEDNEDEA